MVQNFKQCVVYVDIVGFAKRLRLQFVPNPVSPSFLRLFKPSFGAEFQAAPATSQKKDQLIFGR